MRLLLLALVLVLLNGCRYIHTKEPYLDAQSGSRLTIPEGLDEPNASSSLDVKENNTSANIQVHSNMPPEMPIREKQSADGKITITNSDGYAVLSVASEQKVIFDLLSQLKIENWKIENADEDKCQVDMSFTDVVAKEREEAGFFKRLFRRRAELTDNSGLYKLKCQKSGSLVSVRFAKSDNSMPKTSLADDVMDSILELLE